MFRIFKSLGFRGKTYDLRLKNVIRTFVETNVSKALDYYKNEAEYRVPTDHLLYRLISSFTVEMDQDELSFRRRVTYQAESILTGLNVTTSRNRGDYHTETFYGSNCLVYADYETFDESVEAVKVLDHPFVSLTPQLPTLILSFRGDFSVVHINVLSLMLKYKRWIQSRTDEDGNIQGTLSEFLGTVIIPEMIPSQVEVSLRNRYLKVALNSKRSNDISDVPFTLIEPYPLLDGSIERLIDELQDSYQTLSSLADRLPAGKNDSSYWDIIPTEIQELSTESYWVLFPVYLNWAWALLKIYPDIDLSQEDVPQNIKKASRFLQISGAMRMYPLPMKDTIKYKWDELLTAVKKS